jgi:D-galacturonate reductase
MDCSFTSFPSDTTASDPSAYITALNTLKAGDLVFIFTPDDTHFTIAKEAVSRGCHVLVTKPVVKELGEHWELVQIKSKILMLFCS